MECIILAGGLGTRLKNTIGEIPKCMAPVNQQPFLLYLFEFLEQHQCNRIILSLGYKSEIILEWLQNQTSSFEIDFVIEKEPLGTGGGIQLALKKCIDEDVIILNGDTFFDVSLNELMSFHSSKNASTTLALKEMKNYDRYGTVHLDAEKHIATFEEKKIKTQGLINGGIYVINRKEFLNKSLPEKFSFEKDYLEAFVDEQKFYGKEDEVYFIDIGIPEDYQKAQEDFKKLFR